MPPPPPGRDDVTLGEVWRGLTQLRVDVHDDIGRLERKVDALDLVDRGTYTSDQRALDSRLAAVESFRDWAIRAIIGALIVGAVGLLFALASAP